MSAIPRRSVCFQVYGADNSRIAHTGMGQLPPSRSPESEANAAFIVLSGNAYDGMLKALREWKCPGCGGNGTYQQNAAGRARDEARGRAPDPAFNPDPVTCKVCVGNGLHPTASAAIASATGAA